ncbi:uncharacterized protein LOC114741714 [Neltuma alba]|uniref:uncharacterized protein LOC114741714 n=2 Tax=Neltuma alba TaxID=207710 RepID=UPI0010A55D23|nr:uncharacterized protein LOC114741714 [Prosopis alba]
MVEMGIREELAPEDKGTRTFLRPAAHTLSRKEKSSFCEFLASVKVPEVAIRAILPDKMADDSGSSTDNPSQPRDASEQERQLQEEAARIQRGLCVIYIGAVARSTVPITAQHWRRVDRSVRDTIWTDVSSVFDIDESRKRFVEGKAGRVPSLIRDLVKPEDWAAFVTSRRDRQFQELSSQNKERVKKNEYPYRKGRLGYAGLEQEVTQQEGSDVTVSRQMLWALARQNKDGQIDNPRVKEVVDRMESLSQEVSQGAYSADDQDILRRALGTPDHPGLLRGVGYGVTKRDYFGYRQKPSSSCTPSSAEFMELKEETRWLKEQVKAQALLIEQLIKNQAPQPAPNLSPSGKDSCTFPLLPEGEADVQCMADSPKHHTVATGRICKTVAQAVGSFVAWPGRLLTLGHPSKSKGKKSLLGDHSLSSPQKQPSEPVQVVSSRFRICLEEYAIGARLEHGEDFMIPLEFEPEVYGRPSSDYVTNEVLKEILTHGMASTNACNFYIRYLFKNFIAPGGLDDKFKIISPHTFAGHGPNMKKDLSRDLLDIFISRATPGAQTLFLAPYCQG